MFNFIIQLTGQIVWLEKGNLSAGLNHIIQRHSRDFKEKHGVEEHTIPEHLRHVFSEGEVVYMRQTIKNGKMGLEKLYYYNSQYYLLSGVGTNGFIVSGYPIDEVVALKLKGRYGK